MPPIYQSATCYHGNVEITGVSFLVILFVTWDTKYKPVLRHVISYSNSVLKSVLTIKRFTNEE